MWQGRGSLTQLVKELKRQQESKADFVADTRSLSITPELLLAPVDAAAQEWLPKVGLPIKESALLQIGERSTPTVPAQFLRKLAAARPHHASHLLTGLMHEDPHRRMVRCLDGKVRAFLSNSYRTLDHYDLAFSALEAVREAGGEVVEANLSDSHMSLKFVSRGVWDVVDASQKPGQGHKWFRGNAELFKKTGATMPKGEEGFPGGPGTVHPIVTVRNSETGYGGFDVSIGLLEAFCNNMVIMQHAVSKVHLGERLEVGIFTQETISAEGKAIYLKARDAIHAAFKPETFKLLVDAARGATSQEIHAPTAAVANVAKANEMSQERQDALLSYFVKDYTQTRYGLAQAIARVAQDTDDAEEAYRLETLAGETIKNQLVLA